MTTHLHDGLGDIAPDAWQAVSRPGCLDRSHRYLSFLEHVHPGAAITATASDGKGICAAVHGALSTPETSLLSNPWKMLAGSQFLRLDDRDAAHDPLLHETHASLLGQLTRTPSDDAPPALALAQVLGPCAVIRGFDNSEILYRADIAAPDRDKTAAALIAALQDGVRGGLAGAIAFPFVDPADTRLRRMLHDAGFRSGTLTAVTQFDLTPYHSYDDLLAALPGRRRWHFRDERKRLDRDGLRLETVDLAQNAERITELEAANARKHGGAPDPGRLLATRKLMAHHLSGDVRVPVTRTADDTIVACGLHLVSEQSYFCVVYGCDYEVEERSTAYQCVNFYEPLSYATDHAIPRLRLGFEAFTPKLSRGARLLPRETWLWLPDPRRLDTVGDLLRFLSDRCRPYLDDLAARHTPLV